MGHYASEMCCQRCMHRKCVCPPPPDDRHKRWINDSDDEFSPITVLEFDKKYGTIKTRFGSMEGMPMLYRLKKAEFKTKEEATAHSKVLLEKHVTHLESQVLATKAALKDAKARLRKRK